MNRSSESKALEKRERIQDYFWNEVGAFEHISLPKLKDALRKEFDCADDRLIHAQIELMQKEQRIRIESKVKIWVREPKSVDGSSC